MAACTGCSWTTGSADPAASERPGIAGPSAFGSLCGAAAPAVGSGQRLLQVRLDDIAERLLLAVAQQGAHFQDHAMIAFAARRPEGLVGQGLALEAERADHAPEGLVGAVQHGVHGRAETSCTRR
ncbi:hypothetical protein G6F24_015290 [Rhizopus arrhizus]|nr:hypothetical protein G6F24_015290 [Rhizopus arrhizus]